MNKPTASHAASHLDQSIRESDLFEDSLEILIRSYCKKHNIDRSAALNMCLENIRDEMRKRGHEDFNLLRDDWDDYIDEM